MRNLICMFMVLCLGSCSEVIEVDMSSVESKIVIYGYVGNSEVQYLEVSRSVDFYDTTTEVIISDASVSVTDGTSLYPYSYDEEQQVYFSVFTAEQGKTYTLSVEYDFNEDGQNEVYTATTELEDPTEPIYGLGLLSATMMGLTYYVPAMHSTGLNAEEYWYVSFKASIETPLDDNNEISIFEASTLVGSEAKEYIPFSSMSFYSMFFHENDRDILDPMFETATMQPVILDTGDEITMCISTIHAEFYSFLDLLSQSTGGSNPIFGSSAVFLPSNINGDAFGYFGSINTSEFTTVMP